MAYDRMTGRRTPPAGLDPFAISETMAAGRGLGILTALWFAPWRAGVVVAAEALADGTGAWPPARASAPATAAERARGR